MESFITRAIIPTMNIIFRVHLKQYTSKRNSQPLFGVLLRPFVANSTFVDAGNELRARARSCKCVRVCVQIDAYVYTRTRIKVFFRVHLCTWACTYSMCFCACVVMF